MAARLLKHVNAVVGGQAVNWSPYGGESSEKRLSLLAREPTMDVVLRTVMPSPKELSGVSPAMPLAGLCSAGLLQLHYAEALGGLEKATKMACVISLDDQVANRVDTMEIFCVLIDKEPPQQSPFSANQH